MPSSRLQIFHSQFARRAGRPLHAERKLLSRESAISKQVSKPLTLRHLCGQNASQKRMYRGQAC